MDPEIYTSTKEILRIDNELKHIRTTIRTLEAEKEYHREILLNKIGSNTRIKTPIGDIVIDERDKGVRFSIEDIRDIIESCIELSEHSRDCLLLRFEKEESSLRTKIRTLSVKKPHTRKHKSKQRKTNKTVKHTVEHDNSSVSTTLMNERTSITES